MCSGRPASRHTAPMAWISSSVYTLPVSVAWVMLTQAGGIECTSPALRRASAASWAGSSLEAAPSSSARRAPPL